MKVWVVLDCWAYEGGSIMQIYNSKEKAETFKSLEYSDESEEGHFPKEQRNTHFIHIEEMMVY